MTLPFQAYRSSIIFIIALFCGMVFDEGRQAGRILILPALMIILTITLLRFPRGFFRHPASLLFSSIRGNLLNYLVLGNFILLTGAFLIQKQELWIGLALVAAMPASLEIILLGILLRIEKNYVFTSISGTYLGALLIVPLVSLCFFKYIQINYWNIAVLILCLIALPLVLSRLIVEKDWDRTLRKHENTLIDFCHFIVFYAISANSSMFLKKFSDDLVFISLIALTSTFLFYFLIRRIGLYFHGQENKVNFFILLGTMKDYGLAGGIALTLFNPEVAVPPLVFAVFTFIYMNWLSFKARRIEDDCGDV